MSPKSPGRRKSVLGRGLGALLEDSAKVIKDQIIHDTASSISEILISKIESNPFQPRSKIDQESLEELADSIKVQGIIQPVTVRRRGKNRYQLISGERRLQASKMAGLNGIPAFIRTANDQQMLEMALIENIQRENLNAIEIALSYQRLLAECRLNQEQLGGRVGKNRSTVNNYLRLLKLPPDIQISLRDNRITMGHAKAILAVEDIDLQLTLLRKILDYHLSVRNVEQLVRQLVSGAAAKSLDPKPAPKSTPNAEVRKLQTELSSFLGTKILVKSDQKSKGEIRIPFYSAEDLERILEIIDFK